MELPGIVIVSGSRIVGGELHADAEQVLLESGSQQSDLWGANYWPGRGREGCVEYTAHINIRPAQGNRSMEIQARSSASACGSCPSRSSARASRCRELAGGVYLEPDEQRHRALFRALLLLTPASAKQLPFLLA